MLTERLRKSLYNPLRCKTKGTGNKSMEPNTIEDSTLSKLFDYQVDIYSQISLSSSLFIKKLSYCLVLLIKYL